MIKAAIGRIKENDITQEEKSIYIWGTIFSLSLYTKSWAFAFIGENNDP